MENSGVVIGVVLMVLGVGVVITAVFRSLLHTWTLGPNELWILPIAGIGLILFGRWLVR